MNLRAKEPPGLSHPFSQGIGGKKPIPGHLLDCPVMYPEHPGDLDIGYEVLIRRHRVDGITLCPNQNGVSSYLNLHLIRGRRTWS